MYQRTLIHQLRKWSLKKNHKPLVIRGARQVGKSTLVEEFGREFDVFTIEQVDKMRENYVKKYTGFSRYDTRNYDLVLRADGKTEDELVDIILQYMK